MPPKKTYRCSRRVNGRPCPNPGSGNPPLCTRCLDDLEQEEIEEAGYEVTDEGLQGAADRIMDDPRVHNVLDKAAGFFDRFAQLIDGAVTRNGGSSPPRPSSRPPPPRPTIDRARQIAAARSVLLFDSAEPLTEEKIRERRKKLALLVHPDMAGSHNQTVRINQAADILLASLKART